jgi:hypothetical protein
VMAWHFVCSQRGCGSAQKDLSTWQSSLLVFSWFYPICNGAARAYPIYDSDDIQLWAEPLGFNCVAVFVTAAHAQAALRVHPHLFEPLPSAQNEVSFQVCSQCSCYVIRYPEQRTPSDAMVDIVGSFSTPNFYSDSLCRKPCVGHQRRYRADKGIRSPTDRSTNNLRFILTHAHALANIIVNTRSHARISFFSSLCFFFSLLA